MRLPAALLFLLVSRLAAATVPTPESFFGHRMGADRTVLDWAKVVGYFDAVGKSSDRVAVREYGKSEEGRSMIVATIAAPEVLKDLPRYRQIVTQLSDPRGTPEKEAEKLAQSGKTVVLVTCSIHATEIASTHTAVEFAYKMATDDSPKTRAILSNVIVLLVPSLNPDGVDIVTKWYRSTLGTPYEGTSPPELYQKYVGHDNNRDWYIFSQSETRSTISQLQNLWHPQIVYDVHQQGATSSRIFVPPWMDPIDPNIDPVIAQWCNALGLSMAADLTAAGKKSVAVNAMYDYWTPARHYQSYHGAMRILSESASAKLATPITLSKGEISETAIGYSPARSSWNHLEPWEGGTWHLRDIVDYQLISFESLLYQAAIRREDLLMNFYNINRRSSQRMSPFAFVVPATQMDPGSAKKMMETLAFGAVEVQRATEPFAADGKQYSAGDFIIHLQQPASPFAKTLLERQHYPDLRLYPGGPPKRPYDVTAQTLPLLMGVKTVTVEESFTAKAALSTDFAFREETGETLSAADVASYRAAAAAWKADRPVYRSLTTGAFSLRPEPGFRLTAKPRIGLYKSYVPSMDEGWTRWLFDEFGWEFRSVRNEEVLAGGLRAKYDVLIFPDQSESSIQRGYSKGSMPDQFTGGLGDGEALREFAAQGGRLIFFNDSTEYAVDRFQLPLKNVLKGVPNRDFYCPGSLLNVRLDPSSPLAFGVPKELAVWAESSPAWEGEGSVARYVDKNVLASGWLLGERYIAGKSAIADLPLGQGRVILFGMRPQYRAQSYLTFKLLFNAILYSRGA